ncbi:hypothetical protein [Brevibacillus porteri]
MTNLITIQLEREQWERALSWYYFLKNNSENNIIDDEVAELITEKMEEK